MPEFTVTLHLTPVDVWRAQADGPEYLPEAFAADGFIHCTDGEELVLEVGNRYYKSDPRPYCLLTIEPKRVVAKIVYEDPGERYPHIYGPLNTDAVISVRGVGRSPDGVFSGIGEAW